MSDHRRLTFTSRRKRPVLILTASMQRDAWKADRDAASLRRDMRGVHRIEEEARRGTLRHLQRRQA